MRARDQKMIEANSESELLERLASLETVVPARSKGRTKDHTERYAVAHLVSTLAKAGEIAYPMVLERRERPDFRLTMGGANFGIEHTEAISQNDAYKDSIRQEGHGPNGYWLSHSAPGERTKKRSELLEEIQADVPGPGWAGDSVEREWAAGMVYFVKTKLTELQKPGFERFDNDWLLIYDNFCLPSVERERASEYLRSLIAESDALSQYERVFVASDARLCEISINGVRVLAINDLWN